MSWTDVIRDVTARIHDERAQDGELRAKWREEMAKREPNVTGKYVLLSDHSVREELDLLAWARWFETADRIVKQEQIGPYFVSTVFIGLDHGLLRERNVCPLLFETMVFFRRDLPAPSGKEALDICERCSTWAEAFDQHERIASRLRNAQTS